MRIDAIISDSKGTPEMKLFDYLEKHGELENATAALAYFADRKSVNVDCDIFKCYKMLTNNVTGRYGQICFAKFEIELHEGLSVAGRENDHKQTLLHETAHLIVKMIWGPFAKSHGWEWKMVMSRLGIAANRCSSHSWMKDLKKEKCKLIYACKKCGVEIPAMKPRKMVGRYHVKCGGGLYLKEDRRQAGPGVQKLRAVAQNIEQEVARNQKNVIGTVTIKQARYRNRWLKPGVYEVVREFKYKKNDSFIGTITILVNEQKYRVTVKDSPNWFVMR